MSIKKKKVGRLAAFKQADNSLEQSLEQRCDKYTSPGYDTFLVTHFGKEMTVPLLLIVNVLYIILMRHMSHAMM